METCLRKGVLSISKNLLFKSNYRTITSAEILAGYEFPLLRLSPEERKISKLRSLRKLNSAQKRETEASISLDSIISTSDKSELISFEIQCILDKINASAIRGSIVLPFAIKYPKKENSNGEELSEKATAVLARGETASAIMEHFKNDKSENIIVGAEALIDDILTEKIPVNNIGRLYASPDMMPLLMKAARILGPKGLMPSAKTGTLNENVFQAILNSKASVMYMAEKSGRLQIPFANGIFTYEMVKANFNTALKSVLTHSKLPATGAKIKLFDSVRIRNSSDAVKSKGRLLNPLEWSRIK